MFEIADLGRVWILGQVFEHQIGKVREGQSVEATVEAYPGRTFRGTLDFIQPTLDPETRTVAVRFDLENPGHALRPGMFATVTLKALVSDTPAFQVARANPAPGSAGHRHEMTVAEQKNCPVTRAKLGSMGDPIPVEVAGRKVWTCCGACPPKLKARPAAYLSRLEAPPRDQVLSVPESAVIDTGNRKVVYIEAEPGVYEGREVVLGPRVGDRFPVLDGLSPGEKVAARGAFLIDAESRLNPATRPTDADRHCRNERQSCLTRRVGRRSALPEPAGWAEGSAMIESIIEWSIRNRYVVILASLALAIAGVRASSPCRWTRSPTCPRTR